MKCYSPFFLFMHGKDITIPKGTAITAFVQGDDVLDRSKFTRQAQLTAPVAPKQQPVVQAPAMQVQSVSSEPSVADAARQNRANKAQAQQDQSQQAQQQGPNE